MSWSRGKDAENLGKFAYECLDWNGNLYRREGGFASAQEADRAAETAEREMTLRQNAAEWYDFEGPFGQGDAPVEMSDDDILRELFDKD